MASATIPIIVLFRNDLRVSDKGRLLRRRTRESQSFRCSFSTKKHPTRGRLEPPVGGGCIIHWPRLGNRWRSSGPAYSCDVARRKKSSPRR